MTTGHRWDRAGRRMVQLRALALAIAAGTLAGAALPIIAGLVLLSMGAEVAAAGGIMLVGLLIALAVVAPAALLIGLPAALLLRRLAWESRSAYAVAGGVAGGIVMAMLVRAIGGEGAALPGLLGIFAGIVTALTWARANGGDASGPGGYRGG